MQNFFQRIKSVQNVRPIKDVIGYYRKGESYLKNTYVNQQMDRIGFIVKDRYDLCNYLMQFIISFFEIREAMDESLWWKKFARLSSGILKALITGFLLCDYGYVLQNRFWDNTDNVDFVADYVIYGNHVDQRFVEAYDRIIQDHIKKEEMDTLGWLAMGQRLAEMGISEYSFHCFYMAHLLNPKLIKTNSELQFDTALPPGGNTQRESASLDELLNTLLNSE